MEYRENPLAVLGPKLILTIGWKPYRGPSDCLFPTIGDTSVSFTRSLVLVFLFISTNLTIFGNQLDSTIAYGRITNHQSTGSGSSFDTIDCNPDGSEHEPRTSYSVKDRRESRSWLILDLDNNEKECDFFDLSTIVMGRYVKIIKAESSHGIICIMYISSHLDQIFKTSTNTPTRKPIIAYGHVTRYGKNEYGYWELNTMECGRDGRERLPGTTYGIIHKDDNARWTFVDAETNQKTSKFIDCPFPIAGRYVAIKRTYTFLNFEYFRDRVEPVFDCSYFAIVSSDSNRIFDEMEKIK